MKTILIGDIHGWDVWKKIVQHEKADRVIFVGDYFDAIGISGINQISNFKDILDFKKNSLSDVILILGNHDYHYLPYIYTIKTSGYQKSLSILIRDTLRDVDFKIAYGFDNYLITHAGVSQEFLNEHIFEHDINTVVDDLNQLFHHKPYTFDFAPNATNIYGCNTFQTPLWIRPKSLMRANRKSELKQKYVQICGHTFSKKIDTKGRSTGGRYYWIDTLQTSGEYMIIEDGVMKFNSHLNIV